MSVILDIMLKKPDKVYHEGDGITGVIVVNTPTDLKHDGITLSMEGAVSLQVSAKNVGIIEAFYNSIKPVQLLSVHCEVSGPGKVPSGRTEIPFDLPLQPRPNRTLYETYHGVFINISYGLRCDIRRSFLSKDLQKSQQFFVQYVPRPLQALRPVPFVMDPASVMAKGTAIPDFLIRGQLDSTLCSIFRPFTGHVVLERCQTAVRSLELQLVRVETCGCAEGYAREEFEVNLVVIFENDYLVTENFPIMLTRES